jgi:hypothetical protein
MIGGILVLFTQLDSRATPQGARATPKTVTVGIVTASDVVICTVMTGRLRPSRIEAHRT